MMKFLRKKGVMKILLWGIAIVVILSFGILSNAYLLSEKSSAPKYAGKVFGRRVSLEDFQRSYQFVIIQAQLQYGENFNQILPMLNLKDQTWERLILLQEARRQRVSVSDQEVVEAIRNIPFFQNQNTRAFSQNIYEMVLTRGLKISTRAFEEGMRDSLKIGRLFERQTFTISISDEEIAQAYQESNEQIRVSYVLFPTQDLINDIAFDEIKAKAFFLDHKNEFMQPPAINAAYIRFPFEATDPSSKNQSYEKAFNALNDLAKGEDLAAVAKKYSATIEETGFFDMNKPNLTLGWPVELLRSLFSMRIGQFSDIVAASASHDIVQLKEIRPSYIPGYEEVKDAVKTAWTAYEAMNLSRAKAQDTLPQFSSADDFSKTAQALGLTVAQTPDFRRGEYLPDLGPAPEFQQAAFFLTQESPLSGVVQTEKGSAILHLDEYITIDEQKFEEEKQSFGMYVLQQKKMAAFDHYFDQLKDKANLEDLISEHLK